MLIMLTMTRDFLDEVITRIHTTPSILKKRTCFGDNGDEIHKVLSLFQYHINLDMKCTQRPEHRRKCRN